MEVLLKKKLQTIKGCNEYNHTIMNNNDDDDNLVLKAEYALVQKKFRKAFLLSYQALMMMMIMIEQSNKNRSLHDNKNDDGIILQCNPFHYLWIEENNNNNNNNNNNDDESITKQPSNEGTVRIVISSLKKKNETNTTSTTNENMCRLLNVLLQSFHPLWNNKNDDNNKRNWMIPLWNDIIGHINPTTMTISLDLLLICLQFHASMSNKNKDDDDDNNLYHLSDTINITIHVIHSIISSSETLSIDSSSILLMDLFHLLLIDLLPYIVTTKHDDDDSIISDILESILDSMEQRIQNQSTVSTSLNESPSSQKETQQHSIPITRWISKSTKFSSQTPNLQSLLQIQQYLSSLSSNHHHLHTLVTKNSNLNNSNKNTTIIRIILQECIPSCQNEISDLLLLLSPQINTTSIKKNYSSDHNKDSIDPTNFNNLNDTTIKAGRIRMYMNRWVIRWLYFIKEMKENPGKHRQYYAYCACMILSQYILWKKKGWIWNKLRNIGYAILITPLKDLIDTTLLPATQNENTLRIDEQ